MNVMLKNPEVSPRSGFADNVKLDINSLQSKFESFAKNSDGMSSILNVKLIRQRFTDF